MLSVEKFGVITLYKTEAEGSMVIMTLKRHRSVYLYTQNSENFPENLGHCMPLKMCNGVSYIHTLKHVEHIYSKITHILNRLIT